MIKTLRRKFIFTAMVSLFILILILISGIFAIGYYQVEKTADNMLIMLSGDRRFPNMNITPQYPAFGYQINPQNVTNGHFTALLDDENNILTFEFFGMSEITDDEARGYVNEAVSSGENKGKVGSFKFLITENKPKRVIFIDNSMQVRTLVNICFSACLTGAGCMALMFIILFIVSGRVIQPIAQNIEKQQQFVSNAGHEIKTPLGIIMANTEAMELHVGENKWTRNIRSQTERMNGLMNQLLLLARTDEGVSELPFSAVRLSDVVNHTALSFMESADMKHIKIDMDIADDVTMHGNGGSIEQLMNILFDNAVKYTDNGGNISVSLLLNPDSKRCKLIFQNTILSFPEANPTALFDRFYRADPARTQKTGGYGIGLSVANSIVKIHNGKIYAEYISEENSKHKIRFTVEFLTNTCK